MGSWVKDFRGQLKASPLKFPRFKVVYKVREEAISSSFLSNP